MPIDAPVSSPNLPSYSIAMQVQPRSHESQPPPRYEFPPAYTQQPSSSPDNRESSEPATNLTATRIANFHAISRAIRGTNFMDSP